MNCLSDSFFSLIVFVFPIVVIVFVSIINCKLNCEAKFNLGGRMSDLILYFLIMISVFVVFCCSRWQQVSWFSFTELV